MDSTITWISKHSLLVVTLPIFLSHKICISTLDSKYLDFSTNFRPRFVSYETIFNLCQLADYISLKSFLEGRVLQFVPFAKVPGDTTFL
jgi:hypothetical protein